MKLSHSIPNLKFKPALFGKSLAIRNLKLTRRFLASLYPAYYFAMLLTSRYLTFFSFCDRDARVQRCSEVTLKYITIGLYNLYHFSFDLRWGKYKIGFKRTLSPASSHDSSPPHDSARWGDLYVVSAFVVFATISHDSGVFHLSD